MRKILIIILLLSVILINIFNKTNRKKERLTSNYKYNFSVIMNDVENDFEKDIYAGMLKTAKKLNVSLSFNVPKKTESSYKIKDFLDMSIFSKTDGIILFPDVDSGLEELINTAKDKNIPVVTIIKDISKSSRASFIGLNSYDVGTKFNRLLNKNSKNFGKINVAIILQNEENNILNKTLLSAGLESKKIDYETSFLIFRYSELGSLSAEKITVDILQNFPEVNTFICSSPNITLGTLRALVDINKINQMNVLSFGMSEEIRKYMKNNLIDSVIDFDFENFGSNAVKILYDAKTQNKVKEINYLDFHILEKYTNQR